MSFKKNLLAVSLLSAATFGVSHAGSYSYTTGMLILDRVKVQTPTDNYYAQLSLQLSEQNGTFTGLGIIPLPDSFPSADATLTFDVSSNSYILTVLNASGYYGVLTAASINGPYTPSNVISVQANVVGATGATGPKGDTGATGPKGDKGDTGAIGDKGDKGDVGLKGDQGPVGLQGLPGVAGAQGPIGPQGIQGVQGQIGPQGQTGATGATGSSVLNGPTGPTAGNGNPGDFWLDTNSKILYGPKGATAWTGPGILLVGATGSTGAIGATGSMGPQGPAGQNGTNGSPGAPGKDGTNGSDGAPGAQGATGPTYVYNDTTLISNPVFFIKIFTSTSPSNTTTLTFPTNLFSTTPVCTLTALQNFADVPFISNTSTTSVSTFTTISGNLSIICIGSK